MTTDEMRDAAFNALLLGLGRDEKVKSVRRLGDATQAEAEDMDGNRFRIALAVQGVARPPARTDTRWGPR